MLDADAANMDGPGLDKLLNVEELVALAPRFGIWLDEHAIPAEMRTAWWNQGWAGMLFGEALLTGSTADLAPLLSAIEAIAERDGGTAWGSAGWKFASHLLQTLKVSGAWRELGETDMPPTLLAAWRELLYQAGRDETWSYGSY